MDYDVLVVGSGLSGATSARILAEEGQRVLVIEKRDHIGGNCYDYENEWGILIQKYGPHIFHTNEASVWEFVNRFATFNSYIHKVLSLVENKFVPFPINKDTICKVFGVDIREDEIVEFLRTEIMNSQTRIPPVNLRDAFVNNFGERIYKLFFENYTRKQWGKHPAMLLPDIAGRIPVRENNDDRYFSDVYQGIPVSGYTKLIENMLDHPNISIKTQVDYFDTKWGGEPSLTVYTGKLDEFFDYCYGHLEYRSLRFELKNVDVEYFQPAAVVNYPNDEEFTRITEFKHFVNNHRAKTTLCFEYPQTVGEPYYVVHSKENMRMREQYMNRVNELERTGRYLFVGRLAEYKYYNMDTAILAAIKKTRPILCLK